MITIIKRIMRWVRIDYQVKWLTIYARMTLFWLKYRDVTVEKSIVFESFKGMKISDSPLAIFNIIKYMSEFEDYIFYWVVNEPKSEKNPLTHPRVKYIRSGTPSYALAYARSRFWISNCVIPLHFKKKMNQTYIQCWHGTPLKKIGLDVEYDKNELHSKRFLDFAFKLDSSRYDYIVSPSGYASEKFKSAFSLTEKTKIIESGYPRNDELSLHRNDNMYKLEIKKKLDLIGVKKIILFCPTFRDEHYRSKKKSIWYDSLLKLSTAVGEDSVILFRSHYYDSSTIPTVKNLIDVSRLDSVNELFLVSDCLISDYSSVIFDYAILDKPIYIFSKDYNFYKNSTRGMYFDLSEVYGFKVYNNENTIAIAIFEELHQECSIKLKSDFCKNEDGGAANRVIRKVISIEKERGNLV